MSVKYSKWKRKESVMPQKFLSGVAAAFTEQKTGVQMGIQKRCCEFRGVWGFHCWSGSWTHIGLELSPRD